MGISGCCQDVGVLEEVGHIIAGAGGWIEGTGNKSGGGAHSAVVFGIGVVTGTDGVGVFAFDPGFQRNGIRGT